MLMVRANKALTTSKNNNAGFLKFQTIVHVFPGFRPEGGEAGVRTYLFDDKFPPYFLVSAQ